MRARPGSRATGQGRRPGLGSARCGVGSRGEVAGQRERPGRTRLRPSARDREPAQAAAVTLREARPVVASGPVSRLTPGQVPAGRASLRPRRSELPALWAATDGRREPVAPRPSAPPAVPEWWRRPLGPERAAACCRRAAVARPTGCQVPGQGAARSARGSPSSLSPRAPCPRRCRRSRSSAAAVGGPAAPAGTRRRAACWPGAASGRARGGRPRRGPGRRGRRGRQPCGHSCWSLMLGIPQPAREGVVREGELSRPVDPGGTCGSTAEQLRRQQPPRREAHHVEAGEVTPQGDGL